MFHRFTERAWTAIETALSLAHDYRHPTAGADHLVLGLLADPESLAGRTLYAAGVDPVAARDALLAAHPDQHLGEHDAAALRDLGIDLAAVRARVEEAFGAGALDAAGPRRTTRRIGPWRPTPGDLGDDVKTLLGQSLREAQRLGHSHLGTEHLLFALLHTDNAGRTLLLTLGADPAALDGALETATQAA
jgi:ATP-dependent Clp protease ATP-binding subunit ClpA